MIFLSPFSCWAWRLWRPNLKVARLENNRMKRILRTLWKSRTLRFYFIVGNCYQQERDIQDQVCHFLQDKEIKDEEKQNSPWVKWRKEGNGRRCFSFDTMLVFDKIQMKKKLEEKCFIEISNNSIYANFHSCVFQKVLLMVLILPIDILYILFSFILSDILFYDNTYYVLLFFLYHEIVYLIYRTNS